jgi:hypothetical protein
MSGRRLSPREHLLLLVALAVACGMGYWLSRGRVVSRELDAAHAATEATRAKLSELEGPVGDFADPEVLERRLEEARTARASAQRTLEELEGRFVDLGQPAELDRLRLEISALADLSGVLIRENRTCPTAQVHGGDARVRDEVVSLLAGGDPYERPLREITMQSSYEGLRRFLDGLGKLRSFVGVLRFSVEIDQDAGHASGPLLKTTLVLVF